MMRRRVKHSVSYWSWTLSIFSFLSSKYWFAASFPPAPSPVSLAEPSLSLLLSSPRYRRDLSLRSQGQDARQGKERPRRIYQPECKQVLTWETGLSPGLLKSAAFIRDVSVNYRLMTPPEYSTVICLPPVYCIWFDWAAITTPTPAFNVWQE